MEESITFDKFGIMLDCSRNAVMKPERVKEYIDLISDLEYNCLMLYTEDTYEIPNRPYFGHNRGRYSIKELREMDAYAKEKGITMIPCIQTLAHLQSIFRWPAFGKINDCEDILMVGEEETYALIEDMFRAIKQAFSSKIVHIGMDEAHFLGRGKYQDKHGNISHMDIFLFHLKKIAEIAKKYDLELIMWGDMFFRILNEQTGGDYYTEVLSVPEKIKEMIPQNVNIVYWDYYSTEKEHYEQQLKSHALIKDSVWFAGGLWTWTGFAPHNKYSMEITKAALSACRKEKIRNVFLTVWGDNGGECSRFSILPALYYASRLAKGEEDEVKIREDFEKKYAFSFEDFMLLDLPETPNDAKKPVGAEKYFLYNDCFLGLFDSLVKENFKTEYEKISQKLSKVDGKHPYKNIFETQEKLTHALSLKCDLGLRTREAYSTKNMEALKKLLPVYEQTIEALEEFYEAYERQWMWENKPHGFDVQDARIGGAIWRMRHCKKRLEEYLTGKTERIEELEEPLLDVVCRESDNEVICCNSWENSFTANRVYGV